MLSSSKCSQVHWTAFWEFLGFEVLMLMACFLDVGPNRFIIRFRSSAGNKLNSSFTLRRVSFQAAYNFGLWLKRDNLFSKISFIKNRLVLSGVEVAAPGLTLWLVGWYSEAKELRGLSVFFIWSASCSWTSGDSCWCWLCVSSTHSAILFSFPRSLPLEGLDRHAEASFSASSDCASTFCYEAQSVTLVLVRSNFVVHAVATATRDVSYCLPLSV